MKRSKWFILSIVVMAMVGLLAMSCNGEEDSSSGPNPGPVTNKVTGISFWLTNANIQNATAVLPKHLPPGARVVVDARVSVNDAVAENETFTVTHNVNPALAGKVAFKDFDSDSNRVQIDIALDVTINLDTYEWVTVTVTSDKDSTKTAEWKFVVYGTPVQVNSRFPVNDAKYRLLPNLNIPAADVWEGSIPMSDFYRLAGYPKAVFRPDENNSALDNECAEWNGSGHILGDDLLMLQVAPAGSIMRLYFSQRCLIPTNPEDEDLTADPPVTFPGTKIENVNRNGWGVVKFGTMEGDTGDGLTAPGYSPAVTYFIDVQFASALAGMAANSQNEIFVNVFNSSLLMMELWEQVKPITHTNRGFIIENHTTGAFTMTKTSHPEAFALLQDAKDGSYLLVTMESPEVRPGWNIMQIGSSFGSNGKYSEIPIPPVYTTLESGWILFTNKWDVVSVLKKAELFPLADDMTLRFNLWNQTNTGIPGQTGMPIIVSIELHTIDA